jgi:hypothetical protein
MDYVKNIETDQRQPSFKFDDFASWQGHPLPSNLDIPSHDTGLSLESQKAGGKRKITKKRVLIQK